MTNRGFGHSNPNHLRKSSGQTSEPSRTSLAVKSFLSIAVTLFPPISISTPELTFLGGCRNWLPVFLLLPSLASLWTLAASPRAWVQAAPTFVILSSLLHIGLTPPLISADPWPGSEAPSLPLPRLLLWALQPPRPSPLSDPHPSHLRLTGCCLSFGPAPPQTPSGSATSKSLSLHTKTSTLRHQIWLVRGSETRGFAIPWRLNPTVLQSHSSVLPTQTPRASSNTPGGRQHILHSSCTHYWTLSNKTPEESPALSQQQQEPAGAGLSLEVAGERLEEQVKWTSQRKRTRPFLLWSRRNSLVKVPLSSSSHSPPP